MTLYHADAGLASREYWLDPPEDTPVLCCSWCGEGILEGEAYYQIGDSEVCEDCIDSCKFSAEKEWEGAF